MKPTQETVLLYNFNNKENLQKLKGLFIQLNIRIKMADHTQLSQTIGYLMGIKGIEPNEIKDTQTSFPKEMMVMKGFTEKRLDFLLMQIKKSGIPPIGRKAIITNQNQHWSLEKLYKEIEKEHLEMSGNSNPTQENAGSLINE